MTAYYCDDYERITGDATPADNHDRLTPESLKNLTRGDTETPDAISVTAKVVDPAAVDTK
jgi:hypothetical protein